MFLSTNIPALFKKGTLKLVANDEGDLRRVAEAMLVIEPFPHPLARELGDEIAGHLFDDDNRIRPELEAIDLRVRCGLQHVTARLDEALDPLAILSPVSVKDVAVTRGEDKKRGTEWLSLQFVLVFSLEDKAARNFVLDQFGRTLLWSFEAVQRELDGLARMKEAAARLADPLDGGELTSVSISAGGETVTLRKGDAERLRREAKELRDGRTH
jgi:hypothetical protein